MVRFVIGVTYSAHGENEGRFEFSVPPLLSEICCRIYEKETSVTTFHKNAAVCGVGPVSLPAVG